MVALRAAILEKDILVTEALRAISEVSLPGFALTFSGGTCLAKAYRLLERRSPRRRGPPPATRRPAAQSTRAGARRGESRWTTSRASR
jgi:hypothetical protein